MNVSVVSRKGGVGKTVTALHLAGYLAGLGKDKEQRVVLVDTDPSRNALRASQRGGGLPFSVVGEEDAARVVGELSPEHVVVDVKGSPEKGEVEELAVQSEVLVMPAMPGGMELDTVLQTIEDVRAVGTEEVFRVLLTVVPPWPYRRGPEARAQLERLEVPMFRSEVRRYEAFVEATDLGVLVKDVPSRKAHKAWEDYVMVGDELVDWVRDLRTRDLGATRRSA
jgi:chromosome partitioning protein